MIHRLLGGMPRGDGRELLDRIGVGGSEGYDAAMLRQARDRHRAEDLRRAAFDRARGAADGLRLHEVQHPHSGRGHAYDSAGPSFEGMFPVVRRIRISI